MDEFCEEMRQMDLLQPRKSHSHTKKVSSKDIQQSSNISSQILGQEQFYNVSGKNLTASHFQDKEESDTESLDDNSGTNNSDIDEDDSVVVDLTAQVSQYLI